MRFIIAGTLQPVRTALRSSWDPQKGLTVTQEYECAGDNLNGLATQCRNLKMQYDHTPNPIRSRLIFTQSGPGSGYQEFPTDTWQLLANEESKDIKSHPAVHAMHDADPTWLPAILRAIEENDPTSLLARQAGPGSDTAFALYRALSFGVTSYLVSRYVLRHTTNVSNAYNDNVADLNVEYIYSTAALLSEISNGSYWTFPVPGRLYRKIEQMEVQHPSDADWFWGWRKLASSEVTAAGNRIDISTEYWLGAHLRLTNSILT